VLVPPFQGSTFILSCFPRVPQRSILFRLIRMPITTLKFIPDRDCDPDPDVLDYSKQTGSLKLTIIEFC
jgi:hypothetical protein